MTRKDLQLIADVLSEVHRFYDAGCDPNMFRVLRDVRMEFIRHLSRAYPRFDTGRFIRACKLDSIQRIEPCLHNAKTFNRWI